MLDSIPYMVLVPLAVAAALAPFLPEPHLVEKLRMLLEGDLRRAIDVFDLLMHCAPAALLAAKFLSSR